MMATVRMVACLRASREESKALQRWCSQCRDTPLTTSFQPCDHALYRKAAKRMAAMVKVVSPALVQHDQLQRVLLSLELQLTLGIAINVR
jgi:hypothetical protein